MSNLFAIRKDIQLAADMFFGRPILIKERVFHVFDVLTKKGKAPLQVHLWQSLINVLPAVGGIYDRIGSDIESIHVPWPKFLTKTDQFKDRQKAIDWKRTFIRAFTERSTSLSFNSADPTTWKLTGPAESIKVKGILSIEDLASSLITQNFFVRARNHVLYYIAKAANKHNSEIELIDFSRDLIKCFLDLKEIDQSIGNQQFLFYHDGAGFRIQPCGVFGCYNFQESPLPDGSLWVARGNLLQPPKRFTSEAIKELENLIDSAAPEREFQLFFERHPEFLFALGDYSNAHPQLILHEDCGPNLIPDFFLEKIDSDYCDILDLKRANVDLIRNQPRRMRFRDAVMEAVAQLNTYRDWFEDVANREKFTSRYGLKSFRPRVVVIIGRNTSFSDEIQRIRLCERLPRWIKLQTYDEVVSKAYRWKELTY